METRKQRYESLVKDRQFERSSEETLRRMGTIAQAEVPMALLMEDPKWDVFIRACQSEADHNSALSEELRERLVDPGLTDLDTIWRLKIAIAQADAVSQVLRRVVELPRVIRSDAEQAKVYLRRHRDAEAG